MRFFKFKMMFLSFCVVFMVNSCAKKSAPKEEMAPAAKEQDVRNPVNEQPADASDTISPKAFVEKQFAEMVAARTAELQKEINASRGHYGAFLADRESKKADYLSKVQDGTIVIEDYGKVIIEEYHKEKNREKKALLLDMIRSDRTLREYIDATTYKVKDSVLVSGLVTGTDRNGSNVLRAVVPAEGKVLLVTPQVLYAWPGEKSSARDVLSPTEGPYTVEAVWSSRDISNSAADLFNQYYMLEVDSLKAYSLKGYLLIKKESGLAGWIDRDSCAYFKSTETITSAMEHVYKAGFAWAFNGIWQCPISYGRDTIIDRSNGEREIYDFINKIGLTVPGNAISDPNPYPDRIGGGPLNLDDYYIGETTIRNTPLLFLSTGGESKEYFSLTNGVLTIGVDGKVKCPKISNSIAGW